MNTQVKLILLTSIIVLLITIKLINHSQEVEYITSDVDDETYLVREMPDSESASDMLAHLRKDLIDFIVYLKKRVYMKTTNKMKVKIDRLYDVVLPNMKSFNFSESTPSTKYTSYTVNKTKLYFCLRQTGSEQFVNYNTVMFVALHELTHMMNEVYDPDHEHGFWDDMEFILKKAIDNGIYVYQPYNKIPQKYCGIVIDDTPLKA
jgi:hypothetical protein